MKTIYTRDVRRNNRIKPLIETDLGVAPKYDPVSFLFVYISLRLTLRHIFVGKIIDFLPWAF